MLELDKEILGIHLINQKIIHENIIKINPNKNSKYFVSWFIINNLLYLGLNKYISKQDIIIIKINSNRSFQNKTLLSFLELVLPVCFKYKWVAAKPINPILTRIIEII